MATFVQIAQQFGDLIAAEDYVSAHRLLTVEAQAANPPENLKRRAERMRSYASGPITEVEVMKDFILKDWPTKQDGDIACIYVALNGDGFCEAAYLRIAEQDGACRIRDIEWGRP